MSANLDDSQPQVKWYWSSLLGLYLVLVTLTLSYMLYNLWPPQSRENQRQTAGNSNSSKATPPGETGSTGATGTNSNSGSSTVMPGGANSVQTPTDTKTAASGSSARQETSSSTGNTASKETNKDSAARESDTQDDDMSASEDMLKPVKLFSTSRFALTLSHSVEVRLLLIALLAGALGSFIHAGTSFASYVGNRKFNGSWTWWYLLRPLIGMSLALIFYFVVRGGFISPQAGGKDMNPFGIAAMAGLVGMFSKQAIDKLDEVFTTLFGSKGDQKRGDKLEAPTVTTVNPNSGPAAGGTPVKISGSGFLPDAKVTFGGTLATNVVVDQSGKNIAAVTPGHEVGVVDVEVINTNMQKGKLPRGFTYQ